MILTRLLTFSRFLTWFERDVDAVVIFQDLNDRIPRRWTL